MVPRAGVEPATLSLGRIYSIQLSYRGVELIYPHSCHVIRHGSATEAYTPLYRYN